MHLTPNALCLFQEVDVDPAQWPPQEMLSRKSRDLRELISRWWEQLDPEATVGVPVKVMELTLVAMARAAVKNRYQVVTRRWVQSHLDSQLQVVTVTGQKTIDDRLLAALERLGVLSGDSYNIEFTHPALLELYLGLGLALDNAFPKEIDGISRVSLKPIEIPEGRAILARLALAAPEELASLVPAVAQRSLHLMAWFLYFNEAAREKWGEWLAAEILREIVWDQSESCRSKLMYSAASLGFEAIRACRALLDGRAACLPAYIVAIEVVGEFGTEEDIPRLQHLVAGSTALGQWEIDQLRQVLREASALVTDEANRERYTHEENIEFAKQLAGLLLRVAGRTVVQHASHYVDQQATNVELQILGKTVDGIGGQLIAAPGSNFYQQQQALRSLMSKLPGLIEQRKSQVFEKTPELLRVSESAISKLRLRTEPQRPKDPALGWARSSQLKCSFCGYEGVPTKRKVLSNAGWVSLGLLLLCCFPLCWLPLMADGLKKEVLVCSSCGRRLTMTSN